MIETFQRPMNDHYREFIKQIDFAQAQKFLDLFGEKHTFQLFPESVIAKIVADGDRSFRGKILHGTLAEHAETMARMNADGFGVFFMVNEGDGLGRKAENVIRVRAVFADLDGAPLQPVLDCELKPNVVVESSPGKYHAYWLTEDTPLKDFTPIQKSIAAKFNSDKSVNDLPRVLRIPGFFHQKGEPFRVRLYNDDF